jgi:hypothetical protein
MTRVPHGRRQCATTIVERRSRMPQAVRRPKKPGPYQVATAAGICTATVRFAAAEAIPVTGRPSFVWTNRRAAAESSPEPSDGGCVAPPLAGADVPPVDPWEVALATRIRKIPSATAQAATRSGRGPDTEPRALLRGRRSRSRGRLLCRSNSSSLFLWLTELADGLALKELRYASRRFAPAALVGPPWFPRSPGPARGAVTAEIQQ